MVLRTPHTNRPRYRWAYCRCGKELYRWSEAASYTPIQIFREPTVTQSELISHDPQITIQPGTTISATTYESRGSRLQVEIYRVVRISSQRYLVASGRFLASWQKRDLSRAQGQAHGELTAVVWLARKTPGGRELYTFFRHHFRLNSLVRGELALKHLRQTVPMPLHGFKSAG